MGASCLDRYARRYLWNSCCCYKGQLMSILSDQIAWLGSSSGLVSQWTALVMLFPHCIQESTLPSCKPSLPCQVVLAFPVAPRVNLRFAVVRVSTDTFHSSPSNDRLRLIAISRPLGEYCVFDSFRRVLTIFVSFAAVSMSVSTLCMSVYACLIYLGACSTCAHGFQCRQHCGHSQ